MNMSELDCQEYEHLSYNEIFFDLVEQKALENSKLAEIVSELHTHD